MLKERGPTFWRWCFGLALVLVFFMALRPVTNSPQTDWFPQADKLRHAAAFAILWCLGTAARLRSAWALATGLLVLGGGIELMQMHIPGRDASWLDLLADGIGIAAGALALRRLMSHSEHHANR